MKKLLQIFIFITLLINSLLLAEETENKEEVKSKNWLQNLYDTLDVNGFLETLKTSGKKHICPVKDMDDGLIGIEMEHEDIFIFTEFVHKRGDVLFMETNILGQDSSETSQKALQAASTIGAGTGRDDGYQYTNFLELPILTLVAQSANLDGILCLHPKDRYFFYTSSLDVTSTDFMQYYMFIDNVKLFTIPGLMATVFDCMASETYDKLDKTSKTAQYLSGIIDGMNYSFGCNGITSIGLTNQSEAPLVNALVTATTMLKSFARTGLIKQAVKSKITMPGDIYCRQIEGPFIKTQFFPQLLWPVEGKQHTIGASPAEWAAFKNAAFSKDQAVIAWWVRKDFSALNGNCTW